jgi:Family of unknown function (DUF6338)
VLPTTTTALVIVLLAIVPGFIATTMWARARTWKGPSSDFRTTLQSLAVSLALQVIMAPLTIYWIVPIHTHLDRYATRVAVWLLLAVLVVPITLGLFVARFSDWFQRPLRGPVARKDLGLARRLFAWGVRGSIVPNIWDWVFTDRSPNERYLVITFKDGTRVGGVFEEGSYALTSPESPGIYLSREWRLDENGDFAWEIPGSDGLMVNGEDVRSVRVLQGTDETSEAEAADVEERESCGDS